MKKIFISAGHGGGDSGAVARDGTRESDVAITLRNIVAFYLRRAGYHVITDGVGNQNYSLKQAIPLIRSTDFALEIHTNAFHKASAGGVEVLAGTKHKKVSRDISRAVSEVMGIPVRGSDGGWKSEGSGQHSRLGFIRGGGAILETFFISNPKELQTYRDKHWLIGRAIAEAIMLNY